MGFERSLAAYEAAGEQRGATTVLTNLGRIRARQGDYGAALTLFQRALPLHEAVGDRAGVATVITRIGLVYRNLGRDEEALEFLRRALALREELSNEWETVSVVANIDNLGLAFERVFAGSEEALLVRLDEAYARPEPLLFCFFTPHAAHRRYDLVEVALLPYSDACYARAAQQGIDCDYPPDPLTKVFWSGLRYWAPVAHGLLSRMRYTTDDQTAMIAAVEFEGRTPEEAARAWLGTHEAVWRAWLPDSPLPSSSISHPCPRSLRT